MTMRNARRAFTLVELSIVLVIIGLIIGSVLTGQQIIQNARITNAINSIQAYEAQFQTYAQNYGVPPGDDPSATARFPNGNAVGNGGGDGNVGTTTSFNSPSSVSGDALNTAGESRLVWSHLRAAGLVKNQISSGNNAVQPPNPFGGLFGFQTGAFTTLTGTVLCLNNVPADAAQAIDTRLDDGIANKGNIQANTTGSGGDVSQSPTATSGTDTTGYGSGTTYTLCIKM